MMQDRLAGEARRVWEHRIPAVEAPRRSITFRTMRETSWSAAPV
jgi:hypothetical protein